LDTSIPTIVLHKDNEIYHLISASLPNLSIFLDISLILDMRKKWYNIHRSETSHAQKGEMYCIGWRGGYKSGESFGRYCARSTTSADFVNTITAHCERIGRKLCNHLNNHFPLLVTKMNRQFELINAPTITGTCYAFMPITINYTSAPRKYVDDDMLDCYTLGTWYEQGNVIGGQFCFPEFEFCWKIKHGSIMFWDAKHYSHCTATIIAEPASYRISTVLASTERYVQRICSVQKRIKLLAPKIAVTTDQLTSVDGEVVLY